LNAEPRLIFRISLHDDVDALPKSAGTVEGRHRDVVLAEGQGEAVGTNR
jgi:hypothetical protein